MDASDFTSEIVALLPQALILVDDQGRIVSAGGQGLLEIQVDGPSILGKHATNIPQLGIPGRNLDIALQGKESLTTVALGESYFELKLVPRTEEDQPGALISLTNVTSRIHLEAELDNRLYQNTLKVKKNQQEQQMMLDNLNLAILTINKNLDINSGHSNHLANLFGMQGSLAGYNLLTTLVDRTTLPEEKARRLDFDLKTIFGGDSLQWLCTAHAFPNQLEIEKGDQKKAIKTDFKPILDSQGLVEKIMIIFEDISELQKLEHTATEKQAQLKKLSNILAVEDRVYVSFVAEAKTIVNTCRLELEHLLERPELEQEKSLDVILRHIHTLKGSSGLFHLDVIQNACHAFENDISGFTNQMGREQQEKQLSELQAKLKHIDKEVREHDTLRNEVYRSQKNNNHQRFSPSHLTWMITLVNRLISCIGRSYVPPGEVEGTLYELNGALESVGRVPIAFYIDKYDHLVANLAEKYNKDVSPLRVYTSIHYFDQRLIGRLSEIIVHCLTNAISHGIEKPETRREQGKPPNGRITVRFIDSEDEVNIIVEDDGGGISTNRLLTSAVENGHLTEERAAKLTEAEKLDLIFLPRLSSKSVVDIHAGRGIGMDAVKSMTENLGGRIHLDSEVGHGTRISVKVPMKSQSYLLKYQVVDLAGLIEKEVQGTEGFELDFSYSRKTVLAPRQGLRRVLGELAKICSSSSFSHKIKVKESPRSMPHPQQVEIKVSLSRKAGADTFNANDYASDLDNLHTLVVDIGGTMQADGHESITIRFDDHMPTQIGTRPLKVYVTSRNLQKAGQYMVSYFEDMVGLGDSEVILNRGPIQQQDQISIRIADEGYIESLEGRFGPWMDITTVLFTNGPDLIEGDQLAPLGPRYVLAKLPLSKANINQLAALMLSQWGEEEYQPVNGDIHHRRAS